MKEIVRYEANDGTEFDSKDECELYEFQQKIDKNKDSFMLFDSTYKDTLDLDYVMYMYVKDEDGIRIVEEIYDNFGYRTPWDCNPDFRRAGIFYYDERFDVWLDLAEEQNNLTKALTAVSDAIGARMEA